MNATRNDAKQSKAYQHEKRVGMMKLERVEDDEGDNCC
jgi:hypothetical protein